MCEHSHCHAFNVTGKASLKARRVLLGVDADSTVISLIAIARQTYPMSRGVAARVTTELDLNPLYASWSGCGLLTLLIISMRADLPCSRSQNRPTMTEMHFTSYDS